MKFGTLASHMIVLVAGLGIGYYMTKQPAPAPAVIPPQTPAQPWAIPSPGAMYAEQHFPNIHKLGGPAPFYKGNGTNGSLIFID